MLLLDFSFLTWFWKCSLLESPHPATIGFKSSCRRRLITLSVPFLSYLSDRRFFGKLQEVSDAAWMSQGECRPSVQSPSCIPWPACPSVGTGLAHDGSVFLSKSMCLHVECLWFHFLPPLWHLKGKVKNPEVGLGIEIWWPGHWPAARVSTLIFHFSKWMPAVFLNWESILVTPTCIECEFSLSWLPSRFFQVDFTGDKKAAQISRLNYL